MFISLCSSAQPSIHMKITDDAGNELREVAAAKPFILEITVKNTHTTTHAPSIKGLDALDAHKQGVSVSMFNGIATVKQKYQITINRPGVYRLGPAETEEDGQVIRSPVLPIKVGKELAYDSRALVAQQKKLQARKALLHIHVDKHEVFLGEPAQCFVRFLYTDKDISLQAIQTPEFPGFIATQNSGHKPGKQTVDGVDYDYLEWSFDLLPKDVGVHRVTPFAADFIQPEHEDFFGGFSSLFRGFGNKKRIHSNSLSIEVKPLPAYKEPVVAVGHFNALRASIDKPVVHEGDGMLLTLELEGDGNLQLIDTLSLVKIPEGFKAYPSKSYLVDGGKGKKATKRRFEYVLQAMQRGNWDIPSQEITYFDVISHGYKKLHTDLISTTVLPKSSTKRAVIEPEPMVSERPDDEDLQEIDELAPIWLDFASPQPLSWCMPWWLFFALVIMPMIIAVIYRMRHVGLYASKRCASWWYRRKAWAYARDRVVRAEQTHDIQALYGIFVTAFMHRFSMPREEVTEEYIVMILAHHKFSEYEMSEWRIFFEALNAVQYAQYRDYNPFLIQQAYVWIKRFEQRVG